MNGRVEDPPAHVAFLIGAMAVLTVVLAVYLAWWVVDIIVTLGWAGVVLTLAAAVATVGLVVFCTWLGRLLARKMEEPR